MMDQIADLAKSDRLYLIVKEFAAVDLHPKVVSGHDPSESSSSLAVSISPSVLIVAILG